MDGQRIVALRGSAAGVLRRDVAGRQRLCVDRGVWRSGYCDHAVGWFAECSFREGQRPYLRLRRTWARVLPLGWDRHPRARPRVGRRRTGWRWWRWWRRSVDDLHVARRRSGARSRRIRCVGRDRSASWVDHADRDRRRQPELPGAKARRDRRAVPALGLDGRQSALLDRQRARDLRSRRGAHVRRLRASGESRSRHRWSGRGHCRRRRWRPRRTGWWTRRERAAVQAARIPRARRRAA